VIITAITLLWPGAINAIFWAIGARNVRRGLLAPAEVTETEPG
jgi:hypothetical protein